MKEKIKETGEVVETTYQDCHCCYCEFSDGNSRFISINELEYLKPAELIDWEQRRYEIARAALIGIISAPIIPGVCPYPAPSNDAAFAVKYADELIKELKGE